MKVSNYPRVNYVSHQHSITKNDVQSRAQNLDSNSISYASLPVYAYTPIFGANQEEKSYLPKIEEEKKKLTRQLREILDTQSAESAQEDIDARAQQIASNFFSNIEREKEKICANAQLIFNSTFLSPVSKYEQIHALEKQRKMLDNKLKKGLVLNFKVPLTDERIDLKLINRFNNAIQENNFDLNAIYQDYYNDLENIHTIAELEKRYPKIKTPQKPEDVVAQKIASVLTKDFFKEMDRMFTEKKHEEISNYINEKIIELLVQSLEKTPHKLEHIYLKTVFPATHKILDIFEDAKLNDKIDSIPENKKLKIPQITENDINLLSVNFDDFVTTIVRGHYLNGYKLNDIVYDDGAQQIQISQLKEPEYKFQKQTEKIKKFITMAEKAKETERNYDKYSKGDLKYRLDYYSTTPIANNEIILDTIIAFDSCKFEKDDIAQLKKLFQQLDKVYDKQITSDEAEDIIIFENIKPIATERLTEEERCKAEKAIKQEQKRTALLEKVKENFDEAIDILYMNNLNNLANLCSQYRLTQLDKDSLQKSRYLIDVIKRAADKDSIAIENKALIEANILNWHTYNQYEKNYQESEIFKKAVNFAKKEDGSIDKNKAGQYLVNADFVNTYPDSVSFHKKPEILKAIMEKNAEEKEKAVEYLCKYSDYDTMSIEEKSKLLNILKLFRVKDPTDKAILKNIIENDYVNTDTHAQIKQSSDKTTNTTFAKSAKKAIAEKYKFPLCLEFLEGFEAAIGTFAPYENATGIKQTGKNNKALQYKMEAKLYGQDDRLFSSKNDYCFDIYSETGLH